MSKFSIENLLNEKRAGHEPDVFSNDGSFSTQPPVSSTINLDDEIEKMANLLRTAEVAEDNQPAFNERIAAALILTDAISSVIKEAEACGSCEAEDKAKAKSQKEEEKKAEALNEDEEKIASFVTKAKAQGYSDQEVSDFLTKQAKMKVSPDSVKKVLALTAGAAGVGYAGHEVGKKKGKKEVAERASKIMPAVYRAGMLKGLRIGKTVAGEGKE